MNSLEIAILAGLGGMLGWGLADFFAKKTIDRIGDVVTLVWGHMFGTLAIALIALYVFISHGTTITLPSSSNIWIGLAFFGALQAVVYLLVYQGFGKGQLALLNPIFASYSGIVALVSILVFGEVLHAGLLFGLVVVFFGILLLNVDLGALKSRKISFTRIPGFYEVAIAAVLAAIWTIGWDRFILGRDWLSYAVLMYLFMSAVLLAYIAIRRLPFFVVTKDLWKYVVLIGLCETGAYVAISWGYATTPYTSIVALLSGAFSLPTILLARTFLKEKTTRTQTIASVIIVLGIILVSVV